MSEKILLPLFKNDASLENGPITRAAKNTDLTKVTVFYFHLVFHRSVRLSVHYVMENVS